MYLPQAETQAVRRLRHSFVAPSVRCWSIMPIRRTRTACLS